MVLPPSLSIRLQGGVRFLPTPIPPREFGFTRLHLIRLLSKNGQTPWGLPCSIDNPSLKCLGAPTPAVALGTANQ